MNKKVVALFNDQILEQAAKAFGMKLAEVQKVAGFENFIFSTNVG